MEVEGGGIGGVHLAGEEVEVDADVFAIGEGDGEDGFGKGGSAGGWLLDGEGVLCLHPLDELLEQGEGIGSGAFRRHGEVQGEMSLGV